MVWGWVLFLAVVAACVLLVIRGIGRDPRPLPFGGLLWFRQGKTFWGPCCEACLIQFYPRPLFQPPTGLPYYELVCPLCQKALGGRAFTLEALLGLEAELAGTLGLRRVGESPTAALKAFQGAVQ